MSPDALPPGPRLPRPLQTAGWIARPGPWMERCRERYGDTFTLNFTNDAVYVFVSHPDDVKTVFTADPAVLHAGEANVILRPILGHRSVLLLDGPAHLRERKLMLPAFHGERMQRYEALMAEIAEREIATWPAGGPLALWPRMQKITLEIIVRAIFGVDEPARRERMHRRLARMLDWTTRLPQIVLAALFGPDRVERDGFFRRAMRPVDEAILDEIRHRRRDPHLDERSDVLSLLLLARHEDGEPMTDAELRDELMTLLVAGHETTATSLAWALERLLRHPPAWDRLRDEAAAGESLYIDAVVKETLRVRPVVPIVNRRLKAPFPVAGRILPAGVNVAPCIYLVHRRPDVYPDPRAFRPERFLETPAGTYTWLPFGGGVRRCLGASFALFEMKTVLAAVARSARLAPAAPAGERVVRRAITFTPSRGTEVVREAA